MMKRLKSFMGLVAAMAVTVFSAQAQESILQASAPVNQDAPAGVAQVVKSAGTATYGTVNSNLKPVSDFQAKASEVTLSSNKSAKKAPAKKVASVNELAGNYVLTGESLLTSGYNGVSVTVTTLGSDSIVLNNFWAAGYNTVVKAKVDVATGTLTIPYQVMGQHATYGDIVFAKTDLTNGNPLNEAVTAHVAADGSIVFDNAWGSYVKATPTATAWSMFSVVNKATMEKCNATFTGKKHNDGTTESYGVVFKQTSENVAVIKNLGNYGQTVSIELNRNKTANIPSSLIAYNSTYGDFYSYNLTFTETGASLSTDDAVTAAATDLKQLNWTGWGVVTGNLQGSRYLVSAYDECNVTTDADIVYPSISVTDWEGEGTEASPYLIKQRDDLILLSDKVAEITDFDWTTPPQTSVYCRAYMGKYFKVVNDIDMNGYKFTPIANDWQHSFAGTFDGDGHTISNLNVDKKGSYAGLFGRTDTVSVIKNVKLDAPVIKSTGTYAAALVGWSLGTIDNVEVTNGVLEVTNYGVGAVAGIGYSVTNCTVKDTEITGYGYTGGVVGEVHMPITNCVAEGVNIVSATASSSAPGLPIGGVVGNLYMTDMDNCHFVGVINGYKLYSEYQSIGGLAGWASGAKVKNSFATGTLLGYNSGAIVGGAVGFLRGYMENCFFRGDIQAMSTRSCGGAVGRIQAYSIDGTQTFESTMKNVYAAASVNAECYQYQSQVNKQNNEIVGTIINGSNPVFNNVYFDKQVCSLTQSEFGANTADLVSAQGPAGFDASVWSYTAGQYPALKSQASTEASKFATVAIVLPQGATFDKFTKDATIYNGGNSIVGFYKAGKLMTNGYYASIVGNKIQLNSESKFGNDTIMVLNPQLGVNYSHIVKIAPIPFEGAGVEDDPFLLKTKADMIKLSEMTTVHHQLFPDTYFKICNDIDLEYDPAYLGICTDAGDAHNYFAGVLDGDGHFIHKMKMNGIVWQTEPAPGVWGTLNTSACKSYKGLVGRLDASGVVKNVNIANDCDLLFYGSSGAVVGYNGGLVENCRNYSDLTGISCWIGGVVGQNLKDGKMKNCYNEGHVTGGYGQVGGIVGNTVGLVENCMNVGRVEIRQLATNYANQLQSCGGIAGTSSSGGHFVNCVNAGTVSAQIKRAGGITGYWSPVSATSTASYYKNDMINCINYGTVFTADAATMGAMAGGESQSTSEEISGNYWDKQLLDIAADCNAEHAGMTGVETSVLTSGKALEGYDTQVWQFEAGKYPVLKQFADIAMVQKAATAIVAMPAGVTAKNLNADATVTGATPALAKGDKFAIEGNVVKGIPATQEVVSDTLTITSDKFVKIIPISALPSNPLKGSGTAEDPWQLTNAQEWNALAAFMSNTANNLAGEYVKVMNNIDFSNEQAGITPLGADGVTAFAGDFNGNNCTISGYSYVTKVAGEGGLFGTITADAKVYDLTAAGNIEGGLGGAKGTTKLGYVGGVVGKLYGELTNVKNTGKVTGIATYAAGIAAYAYQGSKFNNCANEGEVYSSAANVAGIAAYVYETVEFNNCENSGTLTSATATGYVGGIASYALPSTYNNCTNTGDINGGTSAGIVANVAGKAKAGAYTFDNCVNDGNITGNATLGGITAMQGTTAGNNVCHYINCINNGDISCIATSAVSSSSTAGIAAFYSAGSTFDGCINNGNITNTKSVYTAGITGYYKGSASATYPVVIKNCVNKGGVVSEGQQIAGIIAYVSNYVAIDSCVNYGDIEQSTWGAAGICYTFTGANSSLTNCINFGDITVGTYLAGGIVGNNANNASVLKGCINLGAVTSNVVGTATTNNYGVGGIAGQAYTTVTDCFNAGTIVGQVGVGGIVGRPSYYASQARTQLVNCVNVGMVEGKEGCAGALIGTEAGNEAKYWGNNNSATNCYYLSDFTHIPGAGEEGFGCGDYNIIGTGLNVAGMASLDMNTSQGNGDANMAPAEATWYKADYSYPVPAIGQDNAIVGAYSAAVVLAEGDTYDNVTSYQFHVGTPAGVEWAVFDEEEEPSSIVVITDNDAVVTETCEEVVIMLEVTGAKDDLKMTNIWPLVLNVTEVPTGIDNNTIGKVVAHEAYYTVSGVKVEKPAENDGQVYIIVRQYTDGTINAIKVRN